MSNSERLFERAEDLESKIDDLRIEIECDTDSLASLMTEVETLKRRIARRTARLAKVEPVHAAAVRRAEEAEQAEMDAEEE